MRDLLRPSHLTQHADPRTSYKQHVDSHAILRHEARELELEHASLQPVPAKPRAIAVRISHVSRAQSPKPAGLSALIFRYEP